MAGRGSWRKPCARGRLAVHLIVGTGGPKRWKGPDDVMRACSLPAPLRRCLTAFDGVRAEVLAGRERQRQQRQRRRQQQN